MTFLGAGEILQGREYARRVAYYLFNFVKADAAKGPAQREHAAGFFGSGCGASTQASGTATRSPPATSSSSIWAHPSGSSSDAPSLDQRSMIGHRPRHRSTRAIPPAEWCWLTSRNGTRLYR